MSESANSPFQLGDWLVEPDLNRLSKTDSEQTLEPKTMAVLVYLCQRPGQVVSAEEIIDEVWGGRPMGDNPLYKSVAKLRRALGDDPGKARYIATVSKKGYRLVATVGDQPPAASAEGSRDHSSSVARRIWPLAIGLLAGIVIAAVVFWQPKPAPPDIRTLSTFPGSHSQPSFAPNGQSVAFVNETDGASHIWIVDRETTIARQLTSGDSPDARPRWSPDGNRILFSRNNSLWSVPVGGGEPSEIVRDAYNANWSHDGKRIVFERRYQVWTADAGGGEQQRVEGIRRLELPLVPRWPAFAPDGQRIVYIHTDDTPLGDLWVVPVGSGEPEQITFSPAMGSAPVWAPDGEHIYYSSQRGGNQTLWKVDVAGKTSEALLSGSGDDEFPDISADGSRLIYSNSRERFAIVKSNPDTGGEQLVFESRLMLVAPELSPDRSTLAFFGAAHSGGFQIYTLGMSDTSPRIITSGPEATHAIPRWSADGNTFYFFYTSPETSFARVRLDDGEIEVVVPGWNWNVANGASVNPSESRAVYSRLTGQVPVQTLIRNLASGEDETFYATLEYPRWSRDGLSIAGSLHVDQRFPGDVAICPVVGPKCRTLATSARIPIWSADESELYYVRGFGVSQELFVTASDGSGDERKVMTMAPLTRLGPFYSVTDSGEIIWVRYQKEPGEIWLMELP